MISSPTRSAMSAAIPRWPVKTPSKFGTHAAMVVSFPYSGLLQGAEDYLRHFLGRPHVDRDLAEAIRDAFDRRDAPAVSSRPR
jgi:hypothetical protein